MLENVKGVKCKKIPYYQLLAILTKEVNKEKVDTWSKVPAFLTACFSVLVHGHSYQPYSLIP